MKIPFVDLGRAYEALAPEFDARLLEVARSGAYVLGRNVSALEAAMAEYLGVAHTVAVGSGTDALHLALAGLGVGSGDEIVTTPFTFAATVEAIEYVGAQPVLVDIEADTFNIDVNQLEDAITSKTRCIIPVHLFGLPADMLQIMDIADRHGISVVEDCAHSFGATLEGRATGSFGNAGAFSFYPTKSLGCLGDGGLISTNDANIHRRLIQLRNHGIGDHAEHVRLGFNSRLDELQAAILLTKLGRIEDMNDRRRQIAAHYNSVLSKAGVITQASSGDAHHVYGYFTILVEDRDDIRKRLSDAGIATALYYAKPLHRHEYFAGTCRRCGPLETVEQVARRCLSLPIFPEMTDDEVDYVASTTAKVLA